MSQRRKLSVPQVPAISRDVASSPRAKLVAVPTTPRTIVPFRGPGPRIARPTLVSCAPGEAEPRPARTPQAFLKQIAPIILGVTGGQMMPFWDRLWKAVSAGQTHRMYVVA